MGDFANVYVGATANDHTGDPLRSAFQKINLNFANITAGNSGIVVNAPVRSVAGRTGNVLLTVNDVLGAASVAYVNNAPFTMANNQHWTSEVSTISDALNQLAQRLSDAGF